VGIGQTASPATPRVKLLVTDYAFETGEFVLDENPSTRYLFFMTLGTCYFGVFSIQFKGSGIMIEIAGIPALESMAFGAIGNTVYRKLLFVFILMTGRAVSTQIYELSVLVVNIRHVASLTFLPGMASR